MKPKEAAIIHCSGHQKTDSSISHRNNKADQATAQLVAQTNILVPLVAALINYKDLKLVQPEDASEDLQRAKEVGYSTHQEEGWTGNEQGSL